MKTIETKTYTEDIDFKQELGDLYDAVDQTSVASESIEQGDPFGLTPQQKQRTKELDSPKQCESREEYDFKKAIYDDCVWLKDNENQINEELIKNLKDYFQKNKKDSFSIMFETMFLKETNFTKRGTNRIKKNYNTEKLNYGNHLYSHGLKKTNADYTIGLYKYKSLVGPYLNFSISTTTIELVQVLVEQINDGTEKIIEYHIPPLPLEPKSPRPDGYQEQQEGLGEAETFQCDTMDEFEQAQKDQEALKLIYKGLLQENKENQVKIRVLKDFERNGNIYRSDPNKYKKQIGRFESYGLHNIKSIKEVTDSERKKAHEKLLYIRLKGNFHNINKSILNKEYDTYIKSISLQSIRTFDSNLNISDGAHIRKLSPPPIPLPPKGSKEIKKPTHYLGVGREEAGNRQKELIENGFNIENDNTRGPISEQARQKYQKNQEQTNNESTGDNIAQEALTPQQQEQRKTLMGLIGKRTKLNGSKRYIGKGNEEKSVTKDQYDDFFNHTGAYILSLGNDDIPTQTGYMQYVQNIRENN